MKLAREEKKGGSFSTLLQSVRANARANKISHKFQIALKAMSMRRGVNLKNGFLASAARHTILFSASLRVRPFVS